MKTVAEQKMDAARADFAPYLAAGWRDIASPDDWECRFVPPCSSDGLHIGHIEVIFSPRRAAGESPPWMHTGVIAGFRTVTECMASLRETLDRTTVDSALESMDVAEQRKAPQQHGPLLERLFEAAAADPKTCPPSRLVRGVETMAAYVRWQARNAGIKGWVDMDLDVLVAELKRRSAE